MAAVSAAVATAAAGAKVCFNSCCKHSLEKPQKGWRRRTGEFAELCDRCASAYNDGKFCETFHTNASGWRCCESCGKQIHCGCIVSFHMFVLLDAGGIECITCARRSFILTPNPAWPPPSLFLPLQPERNKDKSVKNWSPMAGSGPVPWHQAPTLFAGPVIQSQLQPRAPMPIDFDVSGGLDRLRLNEKLASCGSDKRKKEEPFGRLTSGGNMRIGFSEVSGKGNSGTISEEQSTFSLNACKHSVVPGTSDSKLANDPVSINGTSDPVSRNGTSDPVSRNGTSDPVSRNGTSDPVSRSGTSDPVSRSGTSDLHKVPRTFTQRPTQSPSTEKTPSTQYSATLSESVVRNGRAKGDVRARSQLLPRYWPRISDEELQQISGDSNSVITPLFEKMLSASDAGRIGRLVLPKKCAEAYFPPISNPEGVPLEIQDLKGREWVFQFRFWPNNNSRMYVLEGITPCIQSMQLLAGDVVTFSRIEPEGKLVMGCRKVSSASSDQGNGGSNATTEHSASGDVKSGDLVSSKSRTKASSSFQLPTLAPRPEYVWSENAKPWPSGQEVLEPKPPVPTKRRKSSLGLKSKRLRIENEDTLELKVTWEQVQGLFRPPANNTPNVFIIDGCEIEEYEDPPVIGRPTFPAADLQGKRFQWVQCEDCHKWRKVPADALLQAKWTCSSNMWDPHRSACSAAQELSIEMLEDLLPTTGAAASKKMKAPEQDPETAEAVDGLDALANLALQENIGLSPLSQNRTKHPRHKPGCSCIVCVQPPSGRPKHKPCCTCVVCKSMQRRFNTLMMKKEKKQMENDSETGSQILQQGQVAEGLLNGNSDVGSDRDKNSDEAVSGEEGLLGNSDEEEDCSATQFKGEIDLNTQPDKEEDCSPKFPAKFCSWKKRSATQPDMEEGRSPTNDTKFFPWTKRSA